MTSETPAPASESAAATAPANKRPQSRIAKVLTPILALVAALAVGLIGGTLIGQNSASASQSGPQGAFPAGMMPSNAPSAPFTSGTVSSVDGDTVTLKLTDGSTVKVTTGDDTTVTTTEDSTLDALAEGDEVTVIGETDADGNVTATSIAEGASPIGMPGGGPNNGTPPNGGSN
jgi:Domain of unknown function (DUF5666)